MARTLDITWPKTTSQRIGWTARVKTSTGSRVTLRSSLRAIASVSRANRTGAAGSAQPAGRSARSSDVTVGASWFDARSGRRAEHVVERRVGSDGCLEIARGADDCD